MTYAKTNLVTAIERLSGGDLAALTQPERDQLDQFPNSTVEGRKSRPASPQSRT
jgi:hypothetical protein